MCGIVGYVGEEQCVSILIDGLRRLEYRGYDSAGVAVHDEAQIRTVRAVGKLTNLDAALKRTELHGQLGVGHTRWATHGKPTEVNAHPHVVNGTAVVHNGIIENHAALRKMLLAEGRKIQSDTDTELAAHLIDRALKTHNDLRAAVSEAIQHLQGAYAIAVISERFPKTLVVARQSSPLVIGLDKDQNFCASDVPALLHYTREVIFLEDGDVACIRPKEVQIWDIHGEFVQRQPTTIHWSATMAEKEGYKHFMLKEIYEQPRAIEDTLRGRIDRDQGTIASDEFGLSEEALRKVQRVVLLGCGTSFHACILGQRWIEKFAGLPASVELASEFRGRGPVAGPQDLFIAVSQSGETSDTLAAAKLAKERGASVLAIANVIGSAIPRMSDAAFYTHAGPEIGVASTKCFSVQMVGLLLFALHLGRVRDTVPAEHVSHLLSQLLHIPSQIREVLSEVDNAVLELARTHVDARDVLFLGRGPSFPIALEGALKLKEVSYIHAEGYAAGEMKHGPIALIDKNVPVLMIMPADSNYERSASNLHEVRAREGQTIAITSHGASPDNNVLQTDDDLGTQIAIPRTHEELSPFLSVLPLQLFAYHVADLKGTDVDQPRNLAKTVTVE